MLTDLPSLKAALRTGNDVSQDNYLSTLIFTADESVKNFLKRDIETRPYTEYHDGTNTPDLILKQRPVWSIQSIYMNPGAYYGQAPQGFPTNTLLTEGIDYTLKIDSSKYYRSDSGIVKTLGGGLLATIAYMPWNFRKGTLSNKLAPCWPTGYGSIKVSYTAGYGLGAGEPPNGRLPPGTTLPKAITHFTNCVAAWIRTMFPVGVSLDIGATSEYVSKIMDGTIQGDMPLEVASGLGMVRRYRELAI